MSDTSAPVAPPPAAPTETPIDTNPQVSPNPVSNTPPEVGKIGERVLDTVAGFEQHERGVDAGKFSQARAPRGLF